MTYTVKEIFKSIQGEGFHAGRVAVFCRFSGCNLWSGREEDRAKAVCKFCDTDFVGGEKFKSAADLADRIACEWRGGLERRFVVLTGGEPLMQVDVPLIDALKERGFYIALETNGIYAPLDVDWVCVSPKTLYAVSMADEIKLVFPQERLTPEMFASLSYKHFSLQPMDVPRLKENTAAALAYCLEHPQWKLSLQTHKFIGVR